MKLPFMPPTDGQYHSYCIHCHNETVTTTFIDDLQKFYCSSCAHVEERAFIIDPSVKWWIDNNGVYWHETAGVFLYNARGEFLFFDRIKSPYGLTVPAGHIGDELPETAAIRELGEEVNVHIAQANYVLSQEIEGDCCRRGSCAHYWHVYTAPLPRDSIVSLGDEGVRPVWLTLEEALSHNLTFAVRYIITHFNTLIYEAMK